MTESEKQAAAELNDIWLDGFIKECEFRGVDPERLLSILIKGQENEYERSLHRDS